MKGPSDIRDLDLTLADLSVLGDPDTLREQADALLSAEGVEWADRYGGAEDSRSIWVTVDARGRLVDVEISHTWTERLPPERFAEGLFGAYTAATQQALTVELAARHANPDEPPATGRAPVGDERTDDEWLAALRATLDDVDARLRAVARTTAEDTSQQESELRSPNGYLTLRLRTGGVVGISGNATALASANTALLRLDVLDVFRYAHVAVEAEKTGE